MSFDCIFFVFFIICVIHVTNVKLIGVGVDQCFQIYHSAEKRVMCEPSKNDQNAIDNLTELSHMLESDLVLVTEKLDQIDFKELPDIVVTNFNDIHDLKLRNLSDTEMLKRFEALINSIGKQISNAQSHVRDDLGLIIKKQSNFLQIMLDKTNSTLHDQYLNNLDDFNRRLVSKLHQLHIKLQDIIQAISIELYKNIEKLNIENRYNLQDFNANLEDVFLQLEFNIDMELAESEEYFISTRDRTDLIGRLQTSLTIMREELAKCHTKGNQLGMKIIELQKELEQEKQNKQAIQNKRNILETSLELLQTKVFQLYQDFNSSHSESLLTSKLLSDRKNNMDKINRITPRLLRIHDCQDALKFYDPANGIYTINPDPTNKPTDVYCNMVDGQAWTVIQQRLDGSVDFFKNWIDYKQGFGEVSHEHWLGLEHIYSLTASRNYTLRVELEDWGNNWYWAEYNQFYLGNEQSNYVLHVDGYTGNSGDSLSYHNGIPFSTKDRNNDQNGGFCATRCHGAWWYKDCFQSNLNGKYYVKGSDLKEKKWGDGIAWADIHTTYLYSMKSSIMKIKPRNSKN